MIKIQTVEVNTVLLDDQETTRVVQWAGTILQVKNPSRIPDFEGVYCPCLYFHHTHRTP